MTLDDFMAYSEVDAILKLLEDDYANKVPNKVKEFFEEERLKEYNPVIDPNVPLEEQNLKRETMILLAILKLNYWCETDEEKEAFKKELLNNEIERKELEQKYNPENLFKNKIKKEETLNPNDQQLIEYKEPNFFKKLIRTIFKMFKKGV